MPIFVKGYMRQGRLVKNYSRGVFGRRNVNQLKRAHQKGGTYTISSPEGVRRQIQSSTLRQKFAGVKGKSEARRNTRARISRKQILNDTYR